VAGQPSPVSPVTVSGSDCEGVVVVVVVVVVVPRAKASLSNHKVCRVVLVCQASGVYLVVMECAVAPARPGRRAKGPAPLPGSLIMSYLTIWALSLLSLIKGAIGHREATYRTFNVIREICLIHFVSALYRTSIVALCVTRTRNLCR